MLSALSPWFAGGHVATKITITNAMEKTLREVASDTDPGNPLATVARQLLARIDDAKSKGEIAKGSIRPIEVVNILREVVGTGVLPLPPNAGPLLAFIKTRVLFLGLDAETVEKAARRARDTWKRPISPEWFVKKIEELLQDPEESRGAEEVTVVGRGD